VSSLATIPELQRRLIFTLLWPVVSMCRRFRVPLDVLEQLTRLAYYEELRRGEKATQAQVADVFGMSLRTVVGLERQYRSEFLAPEYEVELSRQLEELLGQGERTAQELAELVEAPITDVQRALSNLVAAGQARRVETDGAARYVLSERYQSLVRDDLISRVDGLKHQLQVLVSAITRRFFANGGGGPSVARTLAFVGSADDVDAMADDLIRALRMHAIDVEEKALKHGSYDRYGLTLALAATSDVDEV